MTHGLSIHSKYEKYELMKTDLSEPVENKVSETMSYVRVWGYLKEAARLLETDGCERSEVKFKEIHNHSLVLGDETRTLWDFTPLPSGDFSRSSFSVYARQTGKLCGERWGGRARGCATTTWFVDAEFKFSSPDLQDWSAPQLVRQPGQAWNLFHGSFHPNFLIWALSMWIINKNNYGNYGTHVEP